MLASNLLRNLMWSAGTTYNTPPLRLSLQGTRHHLINFIPKLESNSAQKRWRIFLTLLKVIVHKVVSVDALSGLSSDIALPELSHEPKSVVLKLTL